MGLLGGTVTVENQTPYTYTYCLEVKMPWPMDDRYTSGVLKQYTSFEREFTVPCTFNKTFYLNVKYGRCSETECHKNPDMWWEYNPKDDPRFTIRESEGRTQVRLECNRSCKRGSKTSQNYGKEEEDRQRLEEQRQEKEQERIRQEQNRIRQEQQRQEQQRQEQERRRQEEERIRQEQNRIRQEQQRQEQQRQEQERRRQEEERIRQEQNRIRQEQQRQEQQRQEQERRRKEQYRKRQEEQRQEQERRRQEQQRQEQQRQEQERRRQEEERIRQEQNRIRQEQQRQEQERRRQEQKRIREEQKRIRQEQKRQEQQRQEQERRRQEQKRIREEQKRIRQEQKRQEQQRQEQERRRQEQKRIREEQQRIRQEQKRQEQQRQEQERRRQEEECIRQEQQRQEQEHSRQEQKRIGEEQKRIRKQQQRQEQERIRQEQKCVREEQKRIRQEQKRQEQQRQEQERKRREQERILEELYEQEQECIRQEIECIRQKNLRQHHEHRRREVERVRQEEIERQKEESEERRKGVKRMRQEEMEGQKGESEERRRKGVKRMRKVEMERQKEESEDRRRREGERMRLEEMERQKEEHEERRRKEVEILEEMESLNEEKRGRRRQECERQILDQIEKEQSLIEMKDLQCTQALYQVIERDAREMDIDEVLFVKQMFEDLMLVFKIKEDPNMQSETMEDRMVVLQNQLIYEYFSETEQRHWSLFCISWTLAHAALTLTEEFSILQAVVQETLMGEVKMTVEKSNVNRNYAFLLAIAAQLSRNNATVAGRLLLSILGTIPNLSDSSKELLNHILSNQIWNSAEIILFLCSTLERHPALLLDLVLFKVQTYRLDLLTVLSAMNSKDPVECLQKHSVQEADKDVDTLVSEMCADDYPEEVISVIEEMLTHVVEELPKHSFDKKMIGKVTDLVKSMDFAKPDPHAFKRILIGLSHAVYNCSAFKTGDGETIKGYFPRITQLVSLIVLLLPKMSGHKGSLLEIGTGEGKSCILAMFATVLAIRGTKIDIITSTPVLARRDQEEWRKLYDMFGLTSSVIPPPTLNESPPSEQDKLLQDAYSRQIVYGTVGDFAADTLRQEFEKRSTRLDRGFELAIVDEVDHMTLDNGVQVTFLSHESSGLRHAEQVLASIWAMISMCQPVELAETGEIQWAGRIQHFYKTATAAVMGSEISEHFSAFDILQPGLEMGVLTQEDMDTIKQKNKPSDGVTESPKEFQNESLKALEAIMNKLGYEEQCMMLKRFEIALDQTVTFDCYYAEGQRALPLGDKEDDSNTTKIRMLLLAGGRACEMLSEKSLIEATVETLKSRIEYTDKCTSKSEESKSDNSISDTIVVPIFLKTYIENRLPIFVENALRAICMTEGREYMIDMADRGNSEMDQSEAHFCHTIIPVDFRASGVLENNKRWGDGLQQFLEMKHQLAISSLSNVTNYMSNFHYFQRYLEGSGIFGVSGTLGGEADIAFLKKHYDTCCYVIPAHRCKKVVELPSVQVSGGRDAWMQRICETVKSATRRGQVVLVICEDVMTANELQEKMDDLRGSITMYTLSGRHNVENDQFKGGNIIIATNLGGRGTDIKVDKEVNKCGGLFVLLTHFPESRRVEKQVFGRTARKGNPGMVQLVINQDELPLAYQGQSVEVMRKLREECEVRRIRHMENNELIENDIREKLFSSFCKFLSDFDKKFPTEEKKDLADINIDKLPHHFKYFQNVFDYHPALNALTESWALWLTLHEEQISQHHDIESLKADLTQHLKDAADKILKGQSDNFYDHIKQAMNRLQLHCRNRERDYGSMLYWQKAARSDKLYRAISLYNQAYIAVNIQEGQYKAEAIKLLEDAKDAAEAHVSETTVTMMTCLMSITPKFRAHHQCDTNFQRQMEMRLNLFHLWKEHMQRAIDKLKELEKNEDEALTKEASVFSLQVEKNFINSGELMALYQHGLSIVFDVDKKPRFISDAQICFLIGVCQVVAGVLVCALSSGAATQLGFWLISEGVSDMISGIQGMRSGHFDWTDWAISKGISIGMSLASAGFSALRKSSSLGQAAKSLLTGTKRVTSAMTTDVMKKLSSKALKHGFMYAVQEIGKQAALAGLNYITDKTLNAFFEKIMRDAFKESIESAVQGHKHLDQCLTKFIISQVPKDASSEYRIPVSDVERMKRIVLGHTDNIVLGVLSDFSKVDMVISRLSEIHNSTHGLLRKAGVSSTVIQTINYSLIIGEYTSKFVQVLQSFPTKSLVSEKVVQALIHKIEKCSENCKQDSRQNLQEVVRLKQEFLHSVSSKILEELIMTCTHKMTNIATSATRRCVNHAAGTIVSNVLGRHNTEVFFVNQRHNYKMKTAIKHPHEKSLSHNDNVLIEKYVETMDDPNRAANELDIHVLTQSGLLQGKGIKLIVVDHNGKHLTEEMYPGSDKSAGYITLQLTKTPDDRARGFQQKAKDRVLGNVNTYSGHFDILREDGELVPVMSAQQNCLYHAAAQAMDGQQGAVNQEERAQILKKQVKDKIQRDSSPYAAAVRTQMKFEASYSCSKYTILGGGRRKLVQRDDIDRHMEDLYCLKNREHTDNTNNTEYDVAVLYGLGEVDEYRCLRKRQRGVVEADHIPPKDSLMQVLNNPQWDAELRKNNPALHDVVHRMSKDSSGRQQLAMQVLYRDHRRALTTGNSAESKICRKLLAESIKSGDVEKMVKLSLIASHPHLSDQLRKEAGLQERKFPVGNVQFSEAGTHVYYKMGQKQYIESLKDKLIDQNQRDKLITLVEKGTYENTKEYKEILENLKRANINQE